MQSLPAKGRLGRCCDRKAPDSTRLLKWLEMMHPGSNKGRQLRAVSVQVGRTPWKCKENTSRTRLAYKVQCGYFQLQPSLPLIQATLVRGAFGASNTNASRYSEVDAIRKDA
jgi:hypothetical protein